MDRDSNDSNSNSKCKIFFIKLTEFRVICLIEALSLSLAFAGDPDQVWMALVFDDLILFRISVRFL